MRGGGGIEHGVAQHSYINVVKDSITCIYLGVHVDDGEMS